MELIEACRCPSACARRLCDPAQPARRERLVLHDSRQRRERAELARWREDLAGHRDDAPSQREVHERRGPEREDQREHAPRAGDRNRRGSGHRERRGSGASPGRPARVKKRRALGPRLAVSTSPAPSPAANGSNSRSRGRRANSRTASCRAATSAASAGVKSLPLRRNFAEYAAGMVATTARR